MKGFRLFLTLAAAAALLTAACGGKKTPRAEKKNAVPNDEYLQFYQTAGVQFEEGKIEEAVNSYQEALKRNPVHPESCYGLGLCYLQQGKNQEALLSFEKTLQYNPKYWDAFISMGIAYDRMNQTAKAVDSFRRALDSTEANIVGVANYQLGLIQLRDGDAERAYYSFQKALVSYPDWPLAHAKAAEALEKTGKDEQALAHYQSALKSEPNSAEYAYKTGVVLLHLNRRAEARNFFEKTLTIAPNSEYGEKALEYLKPLLP